MAIYLPIQALNRSAALRIDGQKILPTAISYVDVSKASVRKELAYHSSIGQVYVTGPLTGNNSNTVVVTGGAVTAGAGLSVNVSAGEIRDRSTGLYVAGLAATNSAIGANASGNPRIDLVVWDNTSGAVSVVAGTAAVAPVAPATPAGKTLLATVAVANGAGAPGTITDLRPRP
jgi:hypothetical protein